MDVRQRRQRMVQHLRDSQAEDAEIKQYQEKALSQLNQSFRRALVLVAILGSLVMAYFLTRKHPTGPPRRILTLYPRETPIAQALPSFVSSYAIATEANAAARQAVHQARHLQSILEASPNTKVHAWEHRDLLNQVPNAMALDQACGPGFSERYRQWKSNDWIQWCLLYTGHHDAYVDLLIEPTYSLLSTVGKGGLAVQADDGIDPSLIFVPPNSTVPFRTLEWLLQSNDPEHLPQKLLELVKSEGDTWKIVPRACQGDREAYESTARKLASWCRNDDCCAVYDPAQKPFVY